MEIGNAITTSIIGQVKRSAKLTTIVYIIDRIIKGANILAHLSGPEKVIRLEGNNVDIRSLLA
jgi:hypothetical protein